VPPTSESTVGPKGRPLALLSRRELGDEFSYACRVALQETRSRRSGGTLAWLRHPLVEAVLDEITLRYLEDASFEELQMRLYDAMSSREQR
jgi:hypothetical protein